MSPLKLFAALAIVAQAPLAVAVESVSTAPVPAGSYQVDKAHTSLIFRVDHLGFSTYTGRFTRLDAQLQVRPERYRGLTRRRDHRSAFHRGRQCALGIHADAGGQGLAGRGSLHRDDVSFDRHRADRSRRHSAFGVTSLCMG